MKIDALKINLILFYNFNTLKHVRIRLHRHFESKCYVSDIMKWVNIKYENMNLLVSVIPSGVP